MVSDQGRVWCVSFPRDSYWIVKALLLCGMNNTARGMIENMAFLVDR